MFCREIVIAMDARMIAAIEMPTIITFFELLAKVLYMVLLFLNYRIDFSNSTHIGFSGFMKVT